MEGLTEALPSYPLIISPNAVQMCHRDTRIRLTVHLATNTARYLGAHLISVHAENQVSVQVTRTKGF